MRLSTIITVAVADDAARAAALMDSVALHNPHAARIIASVCGVTAAPAGIVQMSAEDLGVRLDPRHELLGAEWFRFVLLARVLQALDGDGDTFVMSPDLLCVGPFGGAAGVSDVEIYRRAPSAVPDDDLLPPSQPPGEDVAIEPSLVVLRGRSGRDIFAAALVEALQTVPPLTEPSGGLRRVLERLIDESSADIGVRDSREIIGWWNASALGPGVASPWFSVDGRAAVAVDLSGFLPSLPTRFHPGFNRLRVPSNPEFARLLGIAEAAYKAHGVEARRDFTLAGFDDGPLHPVVRAVLAYEASAGRLGEVPSGHEAWRAVLEELGEPSREGSPISRYMAALWELREDLQQAYPDPHGADAEGFQGWAWVFGQDVVPPGVRPLRPESLGPLPADSECEEETDLPWGVNVAGFFEAELGLGEAARLVVTGLDAARVPALPVQGSFVPPCRQGAEFTFATPKQAPFPINVLCLNGDAVPALAHEVGDAFFRGRHTIALWWWEVGEVPADWQESFRWVDEVWVATDHIKELIEPDCPVPVHKIVLPVAEPTVASVTRRDLGLPEDEFVFLYIFDYHSTEARKNPSGLVRAFRAAFPEGSGVHLVLKCINAGSMFAHHDRVVMEVGDRRDITFVDGYLSAGEKNALISLSDCYVSPHRSEGFGLTPAEALLLGTPVIATRFGGVLEYLNDENAYLIDYTMRPVGPHAEPYPATAAWADPDLDALAGQMRHVFLHQGEASERARCGRDEIRRKHSPASSGRSMAALIRARYEEMQERERATRPRPPAALDMTAISRDVRSVLDAAGQQHGGVQARLRHVKARARRALTAERDLVDQQLVEKIGALDEKVRLLADELERSRMAAHAETLAQFRRTSAELGAVTRRHDGVARRVDALTRRADHHQAEHHVLPYMAEDLAPKVFDAEHVGRVIGYRDGAADLEPYRAFTDVFRGPEERVREVQRAYLPLLAAHGPVLDIGCGRGELLDLLVEHSIEAIGVDSDAGMCAHATAKGHAVVLADGAEHLRGVAEGSLGAITALEVVEHLSAPALEEFLALARTRLRSGGLLIAETVNPHSLVALKGFWLDPTHHHPLFPEVLLTMARIAGFPSSYVFYPSGTGDAEYDQTRQPMYALVAHA